MRTAILVLSAALLLTACGPGVTGGGGPVPASPPAPGPAPEPPIADYVPPYWGMLKCQRNASCRNPVLNKSADRLRRVFHRARGAMPDGDLGIFVCGRA